jgi:hypothetical protein
MKTMLFAAAALSLVLASPCAFAQASNQGTPNTEHGSGDMMQDGPHAAAAPESSSPSSLPSGSTSISGDKMSVCSSKWRTAVAQGTTAGRSKHDFLEECMSRN